MCFSLDVYCVFAHQCILLLLSFHQWLARLHISPAYQPVFSPLHDVTPSLKVQWRYWTITAIAFGDHIYIMWLTLKKTHPAGCRTRYNIGTVRERQPATRKGDFTASERDDSLD